LEDLPMNGFLVLVSGMLDDIPLRVCASREEAAALAAGLRWQDMPTAVLERISGEVSVCLLAFEGGVCRPYLEEVKVLERRPHIDDPCDPVIQARKVLGELKTRYKVLARRDRDWGDQPLTLDAAIKELAGLRERLGGDAPLLLFNGDPVVTFGAEKPVNGGAAVAYCGDA
jgi:hypothetical protein